MIAVETATYATIADALAGFVDDAAGSAIEYYRDARVAPSAAALTIFFTLLWGWSRGRGRRARVVCAFAWILNAVLLVGSLWCYFRVIESAGRL